jgi:hypothetical protein
MGTPIPKVSERGIGAGPITTYRLSPEELAKYQPNKEQVTSKGNPDKVPFALEEYLNMRLEKSRTAIYSEFKIHPPHFYAWLELHGLKDKQVEEELLSGMRGEKKQANEELPDKPALETQPDIDERTHEPTQLEREEMFAPEHDQPVESPVSAKSIRFVTLKIPVVSGDNVGSYGIQVHDRYEQFGQRLDFAYLDRGAVFQETLQLVQAVMSWLQFDIGQIVVKESERIPTLMRFVGHHNRAHIKEMIAKAHANGWKVLDDNNDGKGER